MLHSMADHGHTHPSMGGSGSSTGIDSKVRTRSEEEFRYYFDIHMYEEVEKLERRHDSASMICYSLNDCGEGIIVKVRLKILK